MEIIVKKFSELNINELYEILHVRSKVFVEEQNCAYLDLDNVDQEAYHVYARENGKIIAYLRVIDKNKRLEHVSIGRVLSLDRKRGVGSEIMKVGIKVAKEKFGADIIQIGAQVQAKHFYQNLGFTEISKEYLEDGIPHVYMIYKI